MKTLKTTLLIFILYLNSGFTQNTVNHWESLVLAGNEWRFSTDNSDIPAEWINIDYDDSNWQQGNGGIGYDDGDDATVITPTVSLFLRKKITITDISNIASMLLHADYDDAFVAYLNGHEIARSNIGAAGQQPAYNDVSNTHREAQLYQGGDTERYICPIGLLQQGENILAIQVHNTGINSSDMSSLFFLIAGIIDQSNDYQSLPSWFIAPFNFISSNLPILVIQTDNNNSIPNEPKIGAHLGIINNENGMRNYLSDSYSDYDGRIGIEIRGASSLMFPKSNYGFETRDEAGENNNVSLLGMPQENDWVLHGPYSDKSLMRNVLSYHIGNLSGQYTPRTRWCELVINNDYRGVYVLTEKIKRDQNRVDIAKVTEADIEGDELTGGYIIKIDRNTAGIDDGWTSSHDQNVFYVYEDPSHDELLNVQKQYIREYMQGFENEAQTLGASAIYENYIDLPSFIDYFLATEIFKHIDGWKLSFYMYKKKDSNGGKLHFGPLWDLNLAYGNYDFGRDPGPEGWSWEWAINNSLRPFWLPQLVTTTEIAKQINCRWQELRANSYATDSLLHFLDQTMSLLEESSQRNFNRWPIMGTYVWPNNYVGDNFYEEFNYLTNWLEDRLEWMDENMVGNCTTASSETELESKNIRFYPNPIGHQNLKCIFNFNEVTEAEIHITDALGQLLTTQKVVSNQENILNISTFPSGVYFYQIHNKNNILFKGKLLKTE